MRLALVCLLVSTHCIGQKITISGYVKDAGTGESLIGATIALTRINVGVASNTQGFYSLSLTPDTVAVTARYVGYYPSTLRFRLVRDTVIVFNLTATVLDEVVISSPSFELAPDDAMLGTLALPAQKIKSLPFILGEVDIMKALQLLPGVHSGDENSTGLYVRGGGPDQNLILLDGAPIYNASHLFGFFSIFNPDAINHIELSKGGFPARYGGRLSSVLDIHMKEGNVKKFKGEGSIGLLSSKLTIEGPLSKDKTSFIVSARRTYIDLLARPFLPKNGPDLGYFFTDLNLKINHRFSDRDHVFISTYFGKDKGYSNQSGTYSDNEKNIKYNSSYGIEWGNVVTSARWNHVFGSRLFGNMSTTFSNYNFTVSQQYDEVASTPGNPEEATGFGNSYLSGIRDLNAKADFDFLPNPNHTIKFGSSAIRHRFSPGVSQYNSSEEGDSTQGATVKYALESATYIEDEWKISERFRINAGVHFSAFRVDSTWYHSLQPRISSRFSLGNGYAMLAAFSLMAQYIHLLTNAGVGLPTDLWVPSTSRIKPQQSAQLAAGVSKVLVEGFRISIEGYYKKMTNLIEYKEGTSYLNTATDWQDKVATAGKGESYGVELLVNKSKGLYTGFLGYTLSRSTRQFETLNFGRAFPYKYDRRHDISFTLNREFKKRIEASIVWVYGSGNAITLPVALFQVTDPYSNNSSSTGAGIYYGERNSERLKSYHRLDVSVSWKKIKKWGERRWTVGLYNAYNRLNPFFVNLELDRSKGKYQYVQYSLFPVIPSVSYSFKF